MRALIGRAVLAREQPAAVASHDRLNIVGRVADHIALAAIADFEDDAIPVAFILQVMRGAVGRKARDHAGPKRCLALIGEQRRFAFKHIDEFVLPRVAVMQRRGGARRQRVRLTPKLRKPKRSPSGRLSRPATRAANASG